MSNWELWGKPFLAAMFMFAIVIVLFMGYHVILFGTLPFQRASSPEGCDHGIRQ